MTSHVAYLLAYQVALRGHPIPSYQAYVGVLGEPGYTSELHALLEIGTRQDFFKKENILLPFFII